MKKIILLLTAVLIITGCKHDTTVDNGKKYTDVSALFVVNPTDRDVPDNGDSWVKSISTSRNIEETESDLITIPDFPVKTPTFTGTAENLSDLEISRAAGNTEAKPVISFKLNQKKNFQNSFDSFLAESKTFKCVYISDYCYIWTYPKEDEDSKLTDEEIVEFADKFDTLYQKQIALCGPKYDGTTVSGDLSGVINPNDKISILLYDIDGDKANQYYWGYVGYDDLYSGRGCNVEAIHIDSWAAKQEKSKNGLFSSLAHEFNHMLNYENKTLKYGLYNQSWYTEMLSMLVEDFFYEDLGMKAVDSSPARLYSFAQGSYIYGFKNWPQRTSVEGYKYSNAYAFGAYLARNYGGAKLIHEICTNEYSNEESVVNAVNKINGTNLTFNDLLKEFPAILYNFNNDDKSLPSLNKSTVDTIEGFEYKLNPINKEVFEQESEIKISIYSTNQDMASSVPLFGYGFHFYSFKEKTDLSIDANDSLLITKI